MSKRRDVGPPPAPEPLPYPVVDDHCHLDIVLRADHPAGGGAGGDGAGDGSSDGAGGGVSVAEAVSAASAVGVDRIVQIGCDLPSARWAVGVAAEHPAIVAGVALHPNEAPLLAERGGLEAALDEIEALAASGPRVRAVGETGLDFYRTGPEGRAAQEESFRRHVDIAKRLDKTLQIHDREAHDAVLDVLDAEGAPERWVMHCFSGDADFARRCLDRGGYLSFSGTTTFKNAFALREALVLAPLDRILVETDAPFLTPTPHRGRPNASYLVPLTVRSMAETRGDDLGELCVALRANTFAAFGGEW